MGLLRKKYNFMSDDQKNRFVNAIKKAEASGVVENFAQIHAQYFTAGIHRTSHFLPWHREMLYRFEQELQKVDSSVTIPYWDSTTDNSPKSPLWADPFLGQFNSTWKLGRALGAPGTHLPTLQQVKDNHQRPAYDTFWYGTDAQGQDGLEVSIHNPPHQWVGGLMASAYSPWDPAFYLHHCWIDMLWAWWQTWHRDAPFVASPSWGDRKWGLHDPLLAWPDRTPADVIDHRELGYRYDVDHWLAAGDVLNPSDCQFSLDGTAMLLFKLGCLQSQTPDQQKVFWRSNDPTSDTGKSCIMQSDGNLVIYDDSNPPQHKPIWASNTVGYPYSYLLIQDDGHVGIYDSSWRPFSPKPWSVPPPDKGRPDGWG
jgi:tyrosinase